MELNRKDYRKYVSDDCSKCAMYIPDNGNGTCMLRQVKDEEWECLSGKPKYTAYIFKLIKK